MPLKLSELVTPTGPQSARARECLQSLGDSPTEEVVSLQVKGLELKVPLVAFRLFVSVLEEIAQGHAVTIIPVHSELTTQQAADILNVSRPYVVKLLENGDMPHHKRGRHRRIRFDDLMTYKAKDDDLRDQAMNEMVALSEELGFGYE